MDKNPAKEVIIVALDFSDLKQVEKLVKDLSPYVNCFKIGLQLIMAVGAQSAINFIHNLGGKVFLDGKFNDIPNTVGAASGVVSALGVSMFNVHASSGIAAMTAAAKNKGNSMVLAVTVLTSLEENDAQLIFGAPSKSKVIQFAKDALISGMDGIICSPQELKIIREKEEFANLKTVVPGIRPQWASNQDQNRIMTPYDAILAGADYLVIGRPITNPTGEINDSVNAVELISLQIRDALERRTK